MLSEKQQELCDAIVQNDLSKIRDLLNKDKVDPNFKDTDWSVLHWAVYLNSDSTSNDIVASLLKYGANPNVIDNNGDTPLHFAAREHYKLKMLHLLNAGADINACGLYGFTPLHRAIASLDEHNRAEAVKFLLEKGANRDIIDNKGKTAIETAEERGYTEIVEIFKEIPVKAHNTPYVKPDLDFTGSSLDKTAKKLNDKDKSFTLSLTSSDENTITNDNNTTSTVFEDTTTHILGEHIGE